MGAIGVPLFFMISGYVMTSSAQRQKSLVTFLRNRFARLYPLFAISLSFSYLVFWGSNLIRHVNTPVMPSFLINLTMTPKLLGDYFANGAHWTLEVELHFYLIMSILIYLGRINFLKLSLFCMTVAEFLLKTTNGYDWIPGLWRIDLHFGLIHFSTYFLLGVIAGEGISKSMINKIICICCVFDLFAWKHYPGLPCLLLYLCFLAAVHNKLKILDCKPLVFLGTISFSLYLFHGPIGYPLIAHLQPFVNINLLIALASSISIAISSILCYRVEQPLYQYLRTKKAHSVANSTKPQVV
ncbi:acyltransferase [Rhodopirellula sp.]|nr:acyltransferase [Rhodopirellula sp.]